jgi:methyl-accepting chemotaxis protein
MRTLKAKLIAGTLVFAALIGIQAMIAGRLTSTAEAEVADAGRVQVEAAILGNRIKLDVVQVQQWLTDISATRGLDGLNDGIDVAAEFAADFEVATDELEALRPDLAPELDELRQVFENYHAVGIEMANAYVRGGPAEGNVMMGEFDAAAGAMGDSVDALVADLLDDAHSSLDSAMAATSRAGSITTNAAYAFAALAILAGGLLARRISRPLHRLAKSAIELAHGRVDGLDFTGYGRDEVGELATAFEQACESTRIRLRLEAEQAANAEASRRLLQKIEHVAHELLVQAEQLRQTSGGALDSVRSSTDLMTSALGNAVTATEEIANSAEMAASLSARSLEWLQTNEEEIDQLVQASTEVGQVIGMVTGVAEQTNLLALNATIEAARAGAAGRGFSVVADEVKSLSSETSGATEKIASMIVDIQQRCDSVRVSSERLAEDIRSMNEGSRSVAGAVTEQRENTVELSELIRGASSRTSVTADETAQAATALAGLAETLRDLVVDSGASRERDVDAVVGGHRTLEDLTAVGL